MPGPNSSPCGDRSLVTNTLVTHDENGRQLAVPVRKREWLRMRGRLYTGKTEQSRKRA